MRNSLFASTFAPALLVPTLALLLAVPAEAETEAPRPGADWPSFRGSRAAGVADGFSTPTEWNVPEGKNLLWKTPIPGLGHSSPIVWSDRVYVTTAIATSGAEQSLKIGLYGDIDGPPNDQEMKWDLLALDKRSGKLLWQKTLHQGKPATQRHTKATHANATAATDGHRLAVMLGSEGLHVLDLDGKLLWKKDFGKLESSFYMVPEAQWGFASSPVFHDGKLIVQVDVIQSSFLAAFDAQTGAELWKTPRTDVPTWSSPTVVDDGAAPAQVVVNGYKHVGGYDLATGKPRWWLKGGGDIPVPTPVAGGGLIYFSSAHGQSSPILAVKTSASGDLDLPEGGRHAQHVAWSYDRGGSYMQTPLLYGGLLYVCKDAGVLTVYQADTGKQVYQQRLAGGQTGFTASAVAADGKVYYTAETGEVFVIKAGPVFELLGKGELGDSALATPAISEGRLYFRTQGSLIAVGATPAKSAAPAAPAAAAPAGAPSGFPPVGPNA